MFSKILPALGLTFCLFFISKNALAQVRINEYSAANLDQFTDNFLEHEDWIELHNTSADPANIGGYFLSDNEENPTKWQLPAGTTIAGKGFMRFWCSARDTVIGTTHRHTNFRLTQTKNNPEIIVLAQPNGAILDSVSVQKTKVGQSRARQTDGVGEWRICTNPSPNGTNTNGKFFKAFADRPSMTVDAGFFKDSVTVAIETVESGGVIYYSLDGNEPTAASSTYTGPMTLKSTTVVKAVVYSPDPEVLPSFIQFNTYFINVSHTLVVVSVAANELKELANGSKELIPVGTFEYFGKDGERKTRSYGYLNSHGQDSWANDQRSLDWISKDEFGYSNALKENIFKYSQRDEYQRVILRASGDDNYPAAHHAENEGSAHMRDDYVQTLAKLGNLSLDLRASERCIVYLNGEYWGVYSFRENPDDHDYTEFFYNQGKYDLQYIETWGNTWAEYGGNKALTDWRSLRTWILSKNMADSANYKYVTDRLDVQSLVDYFVVNQTSVCSDWLNYNTGWWRGLNPAGEHKKWGYILWDNDATFGFYINYTGVPDTTPTAKPCDIDDFNPDFGSADPERHIQILNKLRTNPDFAQFYIARQADLFNKVYNCENMLHVLDSMAAVIEPEMEQHALRWDGTYAEWKKNLGRLRYFIERRCVLLDEGMRDCFQLTGPFDLVFRVEPPGAGSIRINTLDPSPNEQKGAYYGGMANKLEVIPATNTGLVFDRWESRTGGTTFAPDFALKNTDATVTKPDTIVALFRSATPVFEPNATFAHFNVYPTIFQNELTVEFELLEKQPVSIELVNVFGQQIVRFDFGEQSGRQTERLNLDAVDLPSGTFFIRLTAGKATANGKVVKAKN